MLWLFLWGISGERNRRWEALVEMLFKRKENTFLIFEVNSLVSSPAVGKQVEFTEIFDEGKRLWNKTTISQSLCEKKQEQIFKS